MLDITWAAVAIGSNEVRLTIARAKSATSERTTEFIIPNSDGIDSVALFTAYKDAQKDLKGRIWKHFHGGVWTNKVVGHNPLSETGKRIARWLQLPNPERYTGHCFRRSSATAAADAGASLVRLKRIGGWKSDAVAQTYIDVSEVEKKKAAAMLSLSDTHPVPQPPSATSITAAPQPQVVMSFTNCVFNNCFQSPLQPPSFAAAPQP